MRASVFPWTGVFLVAIVLISLAPGCADQASSDASDLDRPETGISTFETAVVRIETENCAETVSGRASGALLSSGLVATVAHALEVRASVRIRDSTGDTVPAQIVYLDIERDLALLEPEVPLQQPSVPLELSDPEVGPVQLLSYADRELGPIVAAGSITRTANVTLDGVGRRAAIRLEGAIEPGDSGGPVLQDGHMVGMVFATTRNVDLGWAIAAEELEAALALVAQGELGVEQLSC